MQQQKLCLKWNNHTVNLLSELQSYQQKDILVDVTISCEGRNIKAHKMILSACSPYFQNIFSENPCQHPIVIINGMKYEDITAILNFMYKGEVNVSHDGLSSFLQAAEALKVKGLAEVCGEKKSATSNSQENESIDQPLPPRAETPKKRHRNRKRSFSDDEGTALSRKQHKEPNSPEIHELSGDESYAGDMSSNGQSANSRVSQNVYSRPHQSSNVISHMDDMDDDYEIEPSKLLEQTLTTENVSHVSINNSSSDNSLRIERIMGNATDLESSNIQEPESPPDIKPIIEYGESSAGPSEGAMVVYNEQSQPGPSNVQDSSLIHDSSPTQEYSNYDQMAHDVPAEILPFLKQRPELSIFGTKNTKPLSQSPSVHYRCDLCPFDTTNHQHYQSHVMEHKSKDYPCPICRKSYKSESRLQIHIQQTHDGPQSNLLPHICVYCEKRFKTSSLLNSHTQRTHFPQVFNCHACSKQFSSKATLRKHIMTQHEVYPK